MLNKRSKSWLVTVTAACTLATACGGGGSDEAADEASAPSGGELSVDGEVIADAELFEAAVEEGTVNVYTSLNEVTNQAIATAFEEDTGLSVGGIVTPTGRLIERIQSEQGAGILPADVIAMPDQSLFQGLVEDGLFVEHRVPADDLIPDEYKSPDGLYYAVQSAPTVIAYNTGVIDEADVPQSWADLPAAAAEGNRVGMVHASQGAGGWGLALFMRQTLGEEYWEELAATDPLLESSVGALAERLGRGEVALAAARPPEVGGLIEQGAPVGFLWPEDGTPMFNFYIAQVAGSENPNAAQVYINWAMSKAGQSVLATEGGDYAVHEEAASPVIAGEELPPLDEVNPFVAEAEDWVGLRDQWISEWNTVFGYRP
jgi:iron(III) transport system substrate-binding protein